MKKRPPAPAFYFSPDHNPTTALLILAVVIIAGMSEGHKCYICGDAASGQTATIFPGESFPECEDDRLQPIIRQCPPHHKGCLTQTNGTKTIRSCGHSEISMNICRTANKVEYCYCQTELCNHRDNTFLSSPPRRQPGRDNYDQDDDEDEERSEGSGAVGHNDRGRHGNGPDRIDNDSAPSFVTTTRGDGDKSLSCRLCDTHQYLWSVIMASHVLVRQV